MGEPATEAEARLTAWAAVRELPRDGLARVIGRTDPWAQWARGVLALAEGDFARSFGLLTPLTGRADEVAGLACARLASGLRQLDEHAAAVRWDERALRSPGQARIDGGIGRAADQVGLGDAAGATRLLARVSPVSVRDQIRWSWVACEIQLLQGRSWVASGHAERALRLSRSWGAPRHEIKSALFLAAAVHDFDPERSSVLLAPVAPRAVHGRLRPLVWPMAAVLGDRAPESLHRAAAEAVTFIVDHLPPGVGDRWLGRPDIADWLRDTRWPG